MLIWKLELRDGTNIAVGDLWPDAKPGQQSPKINAILSIPESRENIVDEDGDNVVTVYPAHFVVTILPDDKTPEPRDETPMPLMRVQAVDVKRTHEVHSWSELKDIVADALGLNEEEEDDEPEPEAVPVATVAQTGS